jgi:hypothetical protein
MFNPMAIKNNPLCFALLLALLLAGGCGSASAQKRGAKGLDVQAFSEKVALAEWLLKYDAVAWQTSDSVMARPAAERERLGNEWFCFQAEDSSWHAVYGRYEHPTYELVFHYRMDAGGTIHRSSQPLDTAFLQAHARALQTANRELLSLKASVNIRFNQYIRQQADSTFTVWIFPAFQPNGYAVYGGEFCYVLDAGGANILADRSYRQGVFRAFAVDEPREITLDYSELEQPSLGAIFFSWYYKRFFTSIRIETRHHTTTPFRQEDNSFTWLHWEKTAPKKKKK